MTRSSPSYSLPTTVPRKSFLAGPLAPSPAPLSSPLSSSPTCTAHGTNSRKLRALDMEDALLEKGTLAQFRQATVAIRAKRRQLRRNTKAWYTLRRNSAQHNFVLKKKAAHDTYFAAKESTRQCMIDDIQNRIIKLKQEYRHLILPPYHTTDPNCARKENREYRQLATDIIRKSAFACSPAPASNPVGGTSKRREKRDRNELENESHADRAIATNGRNPWKFGLVLRRTGVASCTAEEANNDLFLMGVI